MTSTPKKSEGVNLAKSGLSERDIQVIAKAWLCIKEIKDGEPQVNYNKLKDLVPYASADSAAHCWRRIANKLALLSSAPSNAQEASTPLAQKTATPGNSDKQRTMGRPHRRKAPRPSLGEVEEMAAGGDDDEMPPTPMPAAKRQRTGKRGHSIAGGKVEEKVDEDEIKYEYTI
ncbi:hypothetical protein F4775DRAFT_588482 [Biscogniauxia sp. FL1348]|nr:hypothetical protein F4775DRAFT_588482 [Biscogniauxia sp. FL1348]